MGGADMKRETFAKLIDELDAVEGVIFHLQQGRETEGTKTVHLVEHDAPNVQLLRATVTMPGDAWQALEAMKGLAWVLRHLCREVMGARND